LSHLTGLRWHGWLTLFWVAGLTSFLRLTWFSRWTLLLLLRRLAFLTRSGFLLSPLLLRLWLSLLHLTLMRGLLRLRSLLSGVLLRLLFLALFWRRLLASGRLGLLRLFGLVATLRTAFLLWISGVVPFEVVFQSLQARLQLAVFLF
jgi:hypothetical protein